MKKKPTIREREDKNGGKVNKLNAEIDDYENELEEELYLYERRRAKAEANKKINRLISKNH